MPPIVPHDVVSIDADASGFGRCGFCLKLCPAERYVSALSGFAHCDEECRGLAEDQLLNDLEALDQQRQLVLGFVDDELAELIADDGTDDGDDDHDEVWEVDERQFALALAMDSAVSPAPSTALATVN